MPVPDQLNSQVGVKLQVRWNSPSQISNRLMVSKPHFLVKLQR